ncbi:gluconate 2-dehydrogenase subunit 3 family protein [Paracoccus sp. IB05]|uniref:gluconate 2-dehydrogenase subunit 3 family protein n=1 Tax=Paracoccus sp. IB05 TaxID=2779367 RepID=UPI0018E769FF|nr:gluconate 2-dehydrogenase subunit 3 family protein [Paracoccus sp. IB05]MBJ2149797.1 gluconate 2-dehydrogenase subunit 3 family protein [Paracoccus sp. IB05]
MTAPPQNPKPHFPLSHPGRRQFLRVSAASFAAAGLWPSTVAAQDMPPLKDYPRAWLTENEWVFVLAAVARLIPSDGEGPGAIEARVPVFIDRELAGDFGAATDWYMEGPHQPDAPPELGWQSPLSPADIYRAAIPLFDEWCVSRHGTAFADLDAAMQDEALTALEGGDVPLPPELRDFFDILLTNTKEGYFSDPIHGGNHGMAAWVHIGFPGARAHYREWVGRHNIPYPLGPVSISGERA